MRIEESLVSEIRNRIAEFGMRTGADFEFDINAVDSPAPKGHT